MDVAERVQMLLEGEHAQLVALAAQIDRSLQSLDRTAGIEAVAVKAAWQIFRGALDQHMRHEREIVLPLAAEVASGKAPRRKEELATWIGRLEVEHDQLRRFGLALRAAASRDPGLRREIAPVLDLFEIHTRVEELEIFPQATATPASISRRKTSDEILSSLRRVRTEDDESEEEEIEGLLSRIGRWLRGE